MAGNAASVQDTPWWEPQYLSCVYCKELCTGRLFPDSDRGRLIPDGWPFCWKCWEMPTRRRRLLDWMHGIHGWT